MKIVDKKVSLQTIKGCVQGDLNCQRIIYETFYGKMMAVALRYTSDEDEAKDVLQDGFIKVFQKMSHYNDTGSFEGWVRRIVVNTAIDHFRKNKSSLSHIDVEDIGDDLIEADNVHDDFPKIEVGTIIKEIQALSPGYRAVLNLYLFEGYTHKEIAKSLGITEGTSKSNYAKGKLKLRKQLEKYIPKEA